MMNKKEKKEEKQRMRTVATTTRLVTAMALVSCLLLLCGCSSDVLPEGVQPGAVSNEPVPISITNASLDAETISNPATRASTNSSLAQNGKQVKMFLTDGNSSGTKYANRYQELYTYSGSASAWQATKPFYVDSRYANIYAVYDPNNVVTFQSNSTKTATNNCLIWQDYSDTKLWYYGTPGILINNTNAQLGFTLKCAYSRLTLSLSKTSDYPNPCKVSAIAIRLSTGSFYTSAVVDITNGGLSGGDYTSSASITTTGHSIYTSGLSTTPIVAIDRLFPAQKLANGAGLTFTLTVDGKAYSVTVPTAKFNEFKRGVRHTANLVMSGTGIIVSSVSTTDWPAVSNSDADSTFD